MKKIMTLCGLLAVSAPAFAYDYGYATRSNEMSGFAIFTLIVMIAYIILSIVILVRWWKMANDIRALKEKFTTNDSSPEHLLYLVAVGKKDQVQEAAIKMLVGGLLHIYFNRYRYTYLADRMNEYLEARMPIIKRLGLTLPDHLTSGEKFIDYCNSLTGEDVQYSYDF